MEENQEITFGEDFARIMERAREEAVRTGWNGISTDHIMLGILRDGCNTACEALAQLGVDCKSLKRSIDDRIMRSAPIPWSEFDSLRFSEDAFSTLNLAVLEATMAGDKTVSSAHMLIGVSRCAISVSARILEQHRAGSKRLKEVLMGQAAAAAQPAPDSTMAKDIADALAEALLVAGTSGKLKIKHYS